MNKLTKELVASWIPTRKANTYKNKMGHILCVGGNRQMGGAIILSAQAALHAGAGLVTVASAPENLHALHARCPEAMFLALSKMTRLVEAIEKADVIVLGPGLGLSSWSEQIFWTVMNHVKEHQWLILDGDALTLFSQNYQPLPIKNVVFTPHLGEWKRLTNIEAPASDIDNNIIAQELFDAIVVLKKEHTEVYLENELWKNTAGNPSMATGGMGDTLAGIIGSFLGQFENKKEAILAGVYIHSAIADELAKTHYVTLPTKIIEHLPLFMKSLKV